MICGQRVWFLQFGETKLYGTVVAWLDAHNSGPYAIVLCDNGRFISRTIDKLHESNPLDDD